MLSSTHGNRTLLQLLIKAACIQNRRPPASRIATTWSHFSSDTQGSPPYRLLRTEVPSKRPLAAHSQHKLAPNRASDKCLKFIT